MRHSRGSESREQEHLHECDVEPQSLHLAPGTARPNENPLEK